MDSDIPPWFKKDYYDDDEEFAEDMKKISEEGGFPRGAAVKNMKGTNNGQLSPANKRSAILKWIAKGPKHYLTPKSTVFGPNNK